MEILSSACDNFHEFRIFSSSRVLEWFYRVRKNICLRIAANVKNLLRNVSRKKFATKGFSFFPKNFPLAVFLFLCVGPSKQQQQQDIFACVVVRMEKYFHWEFSSGVGDFLAFIRHRRPQDRLHRHKSSPDFGHFHANFHLQTYWKSWVSLCSAQPFNKFP